jgi:hypothetical protein
MLRLVLAALFGLTLRGMASSKEAYDGNVIFENCQPGSSLASFCNGNLIGAIDVLITRGVVFCTPDGLTAEQITSLVMRWLGDHPEKRHLPGPRVAASTLQDNFRAPSCSRASSTSPTRGIIRSRSR